MFVVGAHAPNAASLVGISRQIAGEQAQDGKYNAKLSEALYATA
jgi:hypothetical protein